MVKFKSAIVSIIRGGWARDLAPGLALFAAVLGAGLLLLHLEAGAFGAGLTLAFLSGIGAAILWFGGNWLARAWARKARGGEHLSRRVEVFVRDVGCVNLDGPARPELSVGRPETNLAEALAKGSPFKGRFSLRLRIRNSGDQPAVVRGAQCRIVVGAPPSPGVDAFEGWFPRTRRVAPGGSLILECDGAVGAADRAAIRAQRKQAFLIAYVVYSDDAGNHWEVGRCLGHSAGDGDADAGRRSRFVRFGGKAYNFDREQSPGDTERASLWNIPLVPES